MRGNTDRPQRNGNDRNKRMFANLQGVLNGAGASPLPGSSRTPRTPKAEEPPVEQLDDLNSIIAQISDMSMRPDRSAQQIKRNIASSKFLATLNDQEWTLLAESLLDTALKSGEGDFVAGLFVPLMDYEGFRDAISHQLQSVCSAYIMEGTDKTDSVPTFLGNILSTQWPRGMSKAIDSVNIVLFCAVSIVKGWCIVIGEDNDAELAKGTPNLPSDSDDSEPEEEKPQREDPEIVNKCASAITALCNTTQRSLWMNWPELVDEIYAVIKQGITHNSVIKGDVKTGLLQTLISFHAWTKAKAVTTKSTTTQTV